LPPRVDIEPLPPSFWGKCGKSAPAGGYFALANERNTVAPQCKPRSGKTIFLELFTVMRKEPVKKVKNFKSFFHKKY